MAQIYLALSWYILLVKMKLKQIFMMPIINSQMNNISTGLLLDKESKGVALINSRDKTGLIKRSKCLHEVATSNVCWKYIISLLKISSNYNF